MAPSPRETVRFDARMIERIETVIEREDEFDSKSELIREGTRRLVLEQEIEHRSDDLDGIEIEP